MLSLSFATDKIFPNTWLLALLLFKAVVYFSDSFKMLLLSFVNDKVLLEEEAIGYIVIRFEA